MNTPHTKQIRVTVPVTPEVLEMFQRLSTASGKSVGRLMGEWLDETRDGLEPMIEIMTNFKKAPKAAVQALQLHAAALNEMTAGVVMDAMRLDPETGMAGTARSAAGPSRLLASLSAEGGLTPPSSNTGGKGRKTPNKSKGGSK